VAHSALRQQGLNTSLTTVLKGAEKLMQIVYQVRAAPSLITTLIIINELNHLYRNLVDVVRIRTENQLNEFLASAIRREGPTLIGNVENHKGALARTWRVLEELMEAEA